jgi:hypothetical protein
VADRVGVRALGTGHDPRQRLTKAIGRCIDQERIPPGAAETDAIAASLWALVHGVATLLLVGSLDDAEAFRAFAFDGATLLRGLGVDPDALEVSITAALERVPTVYDTLL